MRSLRVSVVLLATMVAFSAIVATANAIPKGAAASGHSHASHKRCKRYVGHHHRQRRCGHSKPKLKPTPGPVTKETGTKQGPFCDPRVWAAPPNPEECDPELPVELIMGDGPEQTAPESPAPEEAYEITEMKMVSYTDTRTDPPTTSVWGCAKLNPPPERLPRIMFTALYGSFSSAVNGGGGPGVYPLYCSKYINPPCLECVPDNIDFAWVYALNTKAHTFVESEKVKFNFENPEEDVSNVHPGVG